MSGTWADHIAQVNAFIAADRAARAARRTTAQTARATPTTGTGATQSYSDLGLGAENWQGGANSGNIGANTQAATGSWGGGFPNASTIANALDISPTAARAGMTAIGLLSGPLGMGLSAANMLGNAVNTSNNVGMLNGLGVSPGFASTLGGLLGFNGLSGDYTSALNAAMANQYSGFSGLSAAQQPGFNAVDWGGIAQQMDQANAAAQAGSTSSGPSGGMADRGDISAQDLGEYQRGGYTGAGRDGVVQPDKPAGVVHEGELVIPAHIVRMMMGRGMLG